VNKFSRNASRRDDAMADADGSSAAAAAAAAAASSRDLFSLLLVLDAPGA